MASLAISPIAAGASCKSGFLSGGRLHARAPAAAPAARAVFRVFAADHKAIAVLVGTVGVSGVAKLSQSNNGPTKIEAKITGLKPGKHGFHLHQFGDTTNGCISTGPHFNPNGKKHGAPTAAERHAGDLGNVVADASGVAEFTITDTQIPLSGPNAVIGRALVIHELEDDLGLGGHELSPTTGNAGARQACGIVGLAPDA